MDDKLKKFWKVDNSDIRGKYIGFIISFIWKYIQCYASCTYVQAVDTIVLKVGYG